MSQQQTTIALTDAVIKLGELQAAQDRQQSGDWVRLCLRAQFGATPPSVGREWRYPVGKARMPTPAGTYLK